MMVQGIPDIITIGTGAGSLSLAGVFLYLYQSERRTNKSLVTSMFVALQNNTTALTRLTDALTNKTICPLTGTDALAMLDALRKK